jgi:hypothetical protein
MSVSNPTVSVFPDTDGDLILALKQHDDGSVTVDAVDKGGDTIQFGQIFKFANGGGHVQLSTGIESVPQLPVDPAHPQHVYVQYV